MNIDKCFQFIEAFSQMASSANDYLFENQATGKYEIIQDKRKKHLNTKQITNLAQQCLTILRTSWLTDMTIGGLDNDEVKNQLPSNMLVSFMNGLSDREKKVEDLGLAIKRYSQVTLSLPKSRYIRLLNILDFKIASKKDWNILNEMITREFAISIEASILEQLNKESSTKKDLLRQFYNKVLGSSSLRIDDFHGHDQLFVTASFLIDLRDFIDQAIDQAEKEKLTQVLEELFFAFKIELAIKLVTLYPTLHSLPSKVALDLQHKQLRQIAHSIRDQLQKLPSAQINHDHSMILLGGYNNTAKKIGHAVTYQIKKNKLRKFSFQIINSGEFASDFYICKLKEETCAQKDQQALKARINSIQTGQENIQDVTFTDVNLKNDGFVELLAKVRFQVTSMKDVVTYIMSNLYKKGNTNNYSFEGREHKLQKQGKGNCATKSITFRSYALNIYLGHLRYVLTASLTIPILASNQVKPVRKQNLSILKKARSEKRI